MKALQTHRFVPYLATVTALLCLPIGCGDDGAGVTSPADESPDATETDVATTDSIGQDTGDVLEADSEVSQDADVDPDQALDEAEETDSTDTTTTDQSDVNDATGDADATTEPVVGDCPESDSGAALAFGTINEADKTLDILLRNCEPVAGFQLDLIGLEVASAAGGTAGETFNSLSTNNPPTIDGGRVVAVDLGGASIGPTEGNDTLLMTVTYTTVMSGFTEICFAGVVFSSPGPDPHRLDMVVGDCLQL